jgi:cytochrome c oxidase assembly factor CtaG
MTPALSMPSPPLLHLGHRFAIDSWNFEPTVVSGAFIILTFYAYFAIRQQGGFNWGRAASFYTGSAIMLIALVSPLHAGADRLLSLHMLQHVALTTLGPPLVVIGLTYEMLEPLRRPGPLNQTAKIVTNPIVAAMLFTVNMWLWHLPPVYQEAVVNTPLHATMHIAFMAAGILYWWPILQSSPSRLGEGGRLFYLFVTGMPMGLLALLLIATNSVVYSHYATTAPTWGLSPVEDQQVAGVIMGSLGEFAGFIAITWLFFRYIDLDSEEPKRGRDGLPIQEAAP